MLKQSGRPNVAVQNQIGIMENLRYTLTKRFSNLIFVSIYKLFGTGSKRSMHCLAGILSKFS
ncbi:hypothetical protein ASG39_03375 [Rhizobium sp. Leaf371]|nr:hypothetical protein ASG39_03375 [Rhizobium sp. Leaf371]